jgi:hypothetical protein
MISRESFEHVPLDASCCLFLFDEIKFGHLRSMVESEKLILSPLVVFIALSKQLDQAILHTD